MRLLRYLIVSGSAAAMAGAVTLTGVTAATTVAAPARVHHTAPSARFLSEARTALAKYFRHNHPQAMLVHTRHAHAIKGVTSHRQLQLVRLRRHRYQEPDVHQGQRQLDSTERDLQR